MHSFQSSLLFSQRGYPEKYRINVVVVEWGLDVQLFQTVVVLLRSQLLAVPVSMGLIALSREPSSRAVAIRWTCPRVIYSNLVSASRLAKFGRHEEN